MAKKYRIKLEVEIETASPSKDVAVTYAQLLTCPAIKKISEVKECGVVSVEEVK